MADTQQTQQLPSPLVRQYRESLRTGLGPLAAALRTLYPNPSRIFREYERDASAVLELLGHHSSEPSQLQREIDQLTELRADAHWAGDDTSLVDAAIERIRSLPALEHFGAMRQVLEELAQMSWDGSGIDGGDLQDLMEKRGLLVSVPANDDVRGEYDTDTMLVLAWSELGRLKQRLLAFYSPAEADGWLGSPHQRLDGDTPLQRIEAGRAEDVWALIDQLESGAYV